MGTEMPTNIRLTKKEQEILGKKAIKINKLLVGMEMKPMSESELIHRILEKSLNSVEINNRGEITIG